MVRINRDASATKEDNAQVRGKNQSGTTKEKGRDRSTAEDEMTDTFDAGVPSVTKKEKSQGKSTTESRAASNITTKQGGPTPSWMGNVQITLSRDANAVSVPMNNSFTFDPWARERAVVSKLAFEFWAPGHTDRHDSDLWKRFNVQFHYRFGEAGELKSDYANFDGRAGNNARFALDLRKYNPWAGTSRPEVPTRPSKDGQHQEARMQFYFTVNGQKLTPAGAEWFEGIYQQRRTGNE